MRPASLRSLLLMLALVVPASLAPSAAARWSRTYGGRGAGEGIHAVAETSTGKLILLASTDSFGTGTGDAWLIRLNPDGTLLSESVAGNALPGGVDGAVVLDDGGAVFSHRNVRDPFIRHDASISRMAQDGTVAWTTDITADPGRFFVNDLVVASDGTILGVGQASMTDAGPFVVWVIALDADGAVLWQQYHGGVGDTAISFDSGVATSDGGLAVTGWMVSGMTGEDLFVAKLAADGSISWARTIGGLGGDRGASMVELPGGGFVVAGSTDSATASGHAGWIVALDAMGGLLWDVVLGDDEWSDLQAITIAADGRLVALGRISEPGFPTNDLWALGLDAATGDIAWQRAYEGASGDYANEILALAGGDLLLAGTWGWGFPEEDLWLLRTDTEGAMNGCPLVRETTATGTSSGERPRAQFLPPYPPLGTASIGSVVTGTSALIETVQCAAAACPAPSCGAIVATPTPACEGEPVTLTLDVSGGTPPLGVSWDLDGDGIPDATGNPLVASLPAGTTRVTATATDSCVPPSSCGAALDVEVLDATRPGEVSDVRAGAVPLLVLDRGARITFEERGDATAYSVHAGTIGAWYFPDAPSGSACFVPTTPDAPGRLAATPSLAAGSWLVVTASHACAEGSVGRDSFDAERIASGTWTPCGGAP